MSLAKWWSAILVMLAGISQLADKTDGAILTMLLAIWVLLLEWRMTEDDQ